MRSERHLRAVLIAFCVKNLARGASMVLVVTIPLELLNLQSAAVGYLSAAIGAGGLLAGILGGAALLHGRRLGLLMLGGIALAGVAMFVIAGRPTVLFAVAGLAAVGPGEHGVRRGRLHADRPKRGGRRDGPRLRAARVGAGRGDLGRRHRHGARR